MAEHIFDLERFKSDEPEDISFYTWFPNNILLCYLSCLRVDVCESGGTLHIWFTRPYKLNGITPVQILFFILFIARSTWIHTLVICWVFILWGVVCSLCPRNGGMLSLVTKGNRSWIVNPLSATKTNNQKKPLPAYISLTKVIALLGGMLFNPSRVVWFLYKLYSSEFSKRLLGILHFILVQSMITLVDTCLWMLLA